jgi:signal peptidase I
VPERLPGSSEPADPERPAPGTTVASRDSFVAGPVQPDDAAQKDGHRGGQKGETGGILSFLGELPVLVILAFGLALLLKTFVVQAFFIPSGSMEPTLMPGDRVLVQKVADAPHHGDIVVFENPHPGAQPDRGVVDGFLHWLSEGLGFAQPEDEDFIKRVIGLPGDTVELRHGVLFVNGQRTREPYLHRPIDTRDYGPEQVPAGSLLVLGDNRLNSNDSRFGLGFVPLDKVVGKAFVIIWPPSRAGWLH